jgi:hypothetical protein
MGTLDDAGSPLRRVGRSIGRAAAALSLTIGLAAHVGSPDVYYSGQAGGYDVDVAIRPPQVVPGIAEVLVHVADPAVRRVVVRPVYWLAGSRGAPTGDDARAVPGSPGSYAGQLWLMTGGAYSVHVTVTGPAGAGTVIVPVGAVATGQLALDGPLRWLLVVLGLLLAAGLVTAMYAAIGESQVPPGEEIPPPRRRRARRVAIAMVPVVAFIAFGGARWWGAEAARYRRTLYKPTPTHATVADVAGVPTLTLTVLDSAWRLGWVTPVMPDHGKLAHLFIIGSDSLAPFAHLHPAMADASTFTTPLPALPAGRYRLFADVVHESGFERTLVDSFVVRTPLSRAGRTSLDADDASFDGAAVRVGAAALDGALGDGLVVRWAGDAAPIAGRPGVLHFTLHDAPGGPVPVEPYLGMAGHAVVVRRDGRVFIHLHPSGTASMASQLAFALRDRGDTTARGRLRLDAAPMGMTASPQARREISFPYAFPSAGEYRVWVQLRSAGRVRTAAYDVKVNEERGTRKP